MDPAAPKSDKLLAEQSGRRLGSGRLVARRQTILALEYVSINESLHLARRRGQR